MSSTIEGNELNSKSAHSPFKESKGSDQVKTQKMGKKGSKINSKKHNEVKIKNGINKHKKAGKKSNEAGHKKRGDTIEEPERSKPSEQSLHENVVSIHNKSIRLLNFDNLESSQAKYPNGGDSKATTYSKVNLESPMGRKKRHSSRISPDHEPLFHGQN